MPKKVNVQREIIKSLKVRSKELSKGSWVERKKGKALKTIYNRLTPRFGRRSYAVELRGEGLEKFKRVLQEHGVDEETLNKLGDKVSLHYGKIAKIGEVERRALNLPELGGYHSGLTLATAVAAKFGGRLIVPHEIESEKVREIAKETVKKSIEERNILHLDKARALADEVNTRYRTLFGNLTTGDLKKLGFTKRRISQFKKHKNLLKNVPKLESATAEDFAAMVSDLVNANKHLNSVEKQVARIARVGKRFDARFESIDKKLENRQPLSKDDWKHIKEFWKKGMKKVPEEKVETAFRSFVEAIPSPTAPPISKVKERTKKEEETHNKKIIQDLRRIAGKVSGDEETTVKGLMRKARKGQLTPEDITEYVKLRERYYPTRYPIGLAMERVMGKGRGAAPDTLSMDEFHNYTINRLVERMEAKKKELKGRAIKEDLRKALEEKVEEVKVGAYYGGEYDIKDIEKGIRDKLEAIAKEKNYSEVMYRPHIDELAKTITERLGKLSAEERGTGTYGRVNTAKFHDVLRGVISGIQDKEVAGRNPAEEVSYDKKEVAKSIRKAFSDTVVDRLKEEYAKEGKVPREAVDNLVNWIAERHLKFNKESGRIGIDLDKLKMAVNTAEHKKFFREAVKKKQK